jgi:hypothetical protein
MGIASAARGGSGRVEMSQLPPFCRAYDQLKVFYPMYVAYAQITGGAR